MGKLRDSVAGNWISPTWQSSTVYHPLMSGVFTPKAYPDPELQALRTKLASTVDQAAAKKISEDMQRIMWDNPPGWYFGQFFQLRVYNKDIQDVEVRGAPVGSIMTLNQWWGDLSKRAQ